MSYELAVIPKTYTKHKEKKGSNYHSKCVMCQDPEPLAVVDEFENVAGTLTPSTEYEGIFSICTQCGTAHLELVSGEVDFTGPVLIGWEVQ